MEKVTIEHFWQTVLLYLTRPNLINRHYIGAQCINCWQTQSNNLIKEKIEQTNLWSNFNALKLEKNFNLQSITDVPTVKELISSKNVSFVILRKLFRKQTLKSLQNNNQEPDIEYDIFLLHSSLNRFSIIILNDTIYENKQQKFSFNSDMYSYSITFNISIKKLELNFLLGTQSTSSKSSYWLENVLISKLERWIEMSAETTCNNADISKEIQGSITKISIETYCGNYNRLKSKYSIELLEIWKKFEKTDPLKFIFEDIAIASYLLTLWSEERQKYGLKEAQSFVDIGCGNGLLVYILTQEGHPGSGIDVRRRTIWDHYNVKLNLIQEQIDPLNPKSVDQLPKADWMIGNHSDELTPWILFLAARTSLFMRIFLLPCCAFDFDGLKFQRITEESKSQYQGYMDYLQNLAEKFGFRTWRDKLRIPSTKRTCIVGYDRKYSDDLNFNTIQPEIAKNFLYKFDQEREIIVQERLKSRTETMKLRQKEIVVRNCTKIAEHVRQKMLDKIVKLLFEHEKVNFAQILLQFHDPEIISALKNQCGGIQTFVRNHKHIFTIQDSMIQFQKVDALRIPKDQEKREKIRACWFKTNHPNGCPLSDESCRYKH